MRLLLVEDNPDLADAIIRRMRRSGHAVDWQADGLAAASVLRYQSFDLVVLDIGLPKLDGLPGFTLPFVLIGLLTVRLIELAPVTSSGMPSADAAALLTAWLLGIGQVMFLDAPHAAAGLLVAVALASLRDAFWLLTGSALGLLLAGPLGAPWSDGLAGFNPALAALALAQWRGGWRLPLLGMIAAVAIWRACIELGLPTLTLPFLLATWLGLTLRAPRPDRVE